MKQEDLMRAMGNLIRRMFPELGEGTHLAHKGRVVALHGEAGEVRRDGLGTRRYSVDVEPLTPDGEPDDTRPTLLDVALDVPWTGPARGVFGLPAVGALVRVCYYGGSAAHPYVDGVIADGQSVPAVRDGELLVQHRPGTDVRFDPDGRLLVTLTEDAGLGGELEIDLLSTRQDRANVRLTATDVKAGANLDLTLTAPSGGNLTVTLSGEATVTAKKDVRVTSQTGDVHVSAPAGKVHVAGGGSALARQGDDVQVDVRTGLGKIITGSAKADCG